MHIDLSQGVIKQHILKLALPAVVGYLFHTIFNVTDTFFAGIISTQALAALSLSASVFFMVLAIAIGMSEAVTSLVGNALGEKDMPKAQNIALNSIAFALLLSILLSLLGVLSVPYFVEALSDPSYYVETIEYINLILYGALFFIGAFFFNSILNATGDTKSFRNILIVTAFLNILLNYIFIKHFNMGVAGIALATVISEAITMFYLFYMVRKTTLWCGFKAFRYDKIIMIELIKQGFPPSVNMFMMAFGMYVITYFVAPFGKEAVAAFGIGMRIEQIFLMPVIGLNIATLAIISQNNGARTYERISPTVKIAVSYGWVMSTVGVVSFLLFAEYFASLLTSDYEVIKQTALYLRISGLASYGFVVIFIYIAMLQGISKPYAIFPVSVFRQVIAPIIVFTILSSLGLGIFAMWVGLDIIIFSSALFLWWYGEKKLKNLLT
ncbi:MATE family efflux transporter [Candidatus Sulfurimonas marisnigri]|uniref:Multidrug-efflux transporter n=1 Tax=Candidatus Sulfurimonas marisnigri TaxID=2740405 RepID=A0A7S7LYI6_9BACT|nr:MATE family efflux transporter [Candidatus Sulfurimonas marisnigri]QOY53766.1 MATE family efflux transporter [Candidatus Sulfurimonas marisnigri]